MRGNSTTTRGGDADEKHCQPRWCRCKQKLDWAQEREPLKVVNATPNSTEGGGVQDLVVACCNHGDSATKRKGIQPQIFLVEEREKGRERYFLNLVYLKRRSERRKNEEKKKLTSINDVSIQCSR